MKANVKNIKKQYGSILKAVAWLMIVLLILPLAGCGGNGCRGNESDSVSGSGTSDGERTESQGGGNGEDDSESVIGTSTDAYTDTDPTESGGTSVTDGESADTACSDAETDSDTESSSETHTDIDTDDTTDTEDNSEKGELMITEQNGIASVSTAEGLKYTAIGYSSFDKTGFTFVSGLEIALDDTFEKEFNRFTIHYASTAPLKIYVAYEEKGGECEEYFYLEAGEGSFSAVNKSFLGKKNARRLSSIKIDTCEGKPARFILFDISTEEVDVPDTTLYVSGNKYTLGIDLKWGGTINYVADNTCKIDGVENLVNKHDTGRLIQQSYYGIEEVEGEYTPGSFNGNDRWPYNPVQGGDRGNYSSRLIDVVVEEGRVYIKAQPMDWGKVDEITQSYMENTYIIEDDYIRVDNRFVDFSGWEHQTRSQELPAFYTISYLDTFVWYGGTEPWTDGALEYKYDLPFWGDAANNGQCTFTYKESNNETWSAFVNSSGSFGIGLYVPNTDYLKAGRHEYNSADGGTKDASANPCSYIAPINHLKLVAYEALEYSYLLATGSVEEIRSTFKEYKDFTANEGLIGKTPQRVPYYGKPMDQLDFTDSTVTTVITNPNSTAVSYDTGVGATRLTVEGADPYVALNFASSSEELYAEDFRYAELVYMLPKSNSAASYKGQLFIATGSTMAATAGKSVDFSLKRDGEYHTLRVDLSGVEFWSGKINLLRLDYFNQGAKGDVVYIKSFRLVGVKDVEVKTVDFSTESGMEYVMEKVQTDMTFNGSLAATVLTVEEGGDPSITLSFQSLFADDYKTLRIKYMVPKTAKSKAQASDIFFCAGATVAPGESVRKRYDMIYDGEYHVLEIDMSEYDFWSGEINRIRFDYFADGVEGDVFYIKSIELIKE